MTIGFTGTRKGLTGAQLASLKSILSDKVGCEFHHGDCIGADAQAHDAAVCLGLIPVIHPPTDRSARAFKSAKRIEPCHDYLDRNKNIVYSSATLIAAPGETTEKLRSGTWSTVRFARKLGRRLTIIFPDGTIK
jgi:hypothetical protein